MPHPDNIEIVKRYTDKQYGTDIKLHNCEDKNQRFDIYAEDRNFHLSIEYKNREFDDDTQKYMKRDDILIEQVQTLPYFVNNCIPTNGNIIRFYNVTQVNTAIGWFYKCDADRLYYIKYFNNHFHEIVDIAFRAFKSWFLNNTHLFNPQYSDKTTGTINAEVPYIQIPSPLITVIDKNGNKRTEFYAEVDD